MATPRHLVEPPASVPYRYGLFSVATPRTTELTLDGADPHWRNGITWVSQSCGAVGATQEFCIDEVDPELAPDERCDVREFEPFTVYAYNDDSIPGFSLSEHEAHAVQRLLHAEQYAVENVVWDRLVDESDTCTDASTTPAYVGLGIAEQELADLYRGMGVLHMNAATATVLCDNLYADGQIMRTKLGTPVVVGRGYEVPGVIYGTGPLVIYRGDVDTRQQAISKPNNKVSYIAQRDYVVGWDCGVLCVTLSECNICLPNFEGGAG
jgi:hypothetical protein